MFCARICGQCAWSSAAEPSGDVARPVLRKNERHDACTATGARGSAVKRPVAGRSAAMSGNYLPSRASLPPLELLLASGPGSVDLHPGRPRTKKSVLKSRVNLGVAEVRKKKKKMKPAPQSGEALRYAGMVCEENLQPCSDQVRQEGEKALPIVPSPSELREDRAWARTERSSEVRKTLRKRLSLGDPRSEKFTFKAPSQEAENAVATLAKAIRRRFKGRSAGSGSGVFGGKENEDSLEQPLLAAPAWACQDVDTRARRFLGRFLANALRSMQRFLRPWVGADTTAEELSRVFTYLEAVFNQCYTKECVWDPHSPGDAYTGRGHLLPPGRRQDEDGRPLDPAVQGGGDVRIRRFMDARTPPRVVSRGGCRADVAVRAGSHCTTRVAASTPGRRRRYQERIGGRQRHEFLDKRGCPCRESECPKGQSSDFSRRTSRFRGTAHSRGSCLRGDDEKSWRCKADSKSEEETDCGLEDEAQRKGRRGRQSPSASGFRGVGTRESKDCTSARAWKVLSQPWQAKVQGVWEAGAEQQLRTCAVKAWSMSAFVAAAAPRLTPAAEVLRIVDWMSTRDGRLGLATPGLLQTVFGGPSRERRQGDTPPLLVRWKWPPFADVVLHAVGTCRSRRRHHSGEHGQCGRVAEVWRLACSGCGHIRNLQAPRERSRAVQVPSWQQIIEGGRYLLPGALEDGALETLSLTVRKFCLASGSDGGGRSQRFQRHLRC